MNIGLKYCGGCNPDYDRVELVATIQERLRGRVDFVSPESEGIDLILAVQGCGTACADLSLFQGMRIFSVTGIADAGKFLRMINEGDTF